MQQQDFEGEMLHQVNRPADTSRPACKSVEDSANRMIYNLKIAQLKGGGGHYDAACTIYKQLRSSQHRNGCITKTLSDAAGSGADAMAARTQKASYIKSGLQPINVPHECTCPYHNYTCHVHPASAVDAAESSNPYPGKCQIQL